MHATQSTLKNETLNYHPVCATKKAKFDHGTHARPAAVTDPAIRTPSRPSRPSPLILQPCTVRPCAACTLPAQNELTH
eukprot:4621850-Prymnesium_polylepis.1